MELQASRARARIGAKGQPVLLLHGDLKDPDARIAQAQPWFGEQPIVASVMGHNAHSWALTDFALRPSGFERILVIAPSNTSQTRAGRVSQRLLELDNPLVRLELVCDILERTGISL